METNYQKNQIKRKIKNKRKRRKENQNLISLLRLMKEHNQHNKLIYKMLMTLKNQNNITKI